MLKIEPGKKFLEKVTKNYTLDYLAAVAIESKEKITKQGIRSQIKKGVLPYCVYEKVKDDIMKIIEEEKLIKSLVE